MATSSQFVRGFDDFFVSRSLTTVPRVVSVFSVALSPAGIGTRSASGRRQAAIHASVSSHCLVTVSSHGLISVISASGAVVATHRLSHSSPTGTQNPNGDASTTTKEVRALQVTAASLGGDQQPYIAVATTDGFLWLVEMTVFVDGQRVLGRSLAKMAIDARASQSRSGDEPASEATGAAESKADGDTATIANNATAPQPTANDGGTTLRDSDPALEAGASDWRPRRATPAHPDAPAGAGTSALLYQGVRVVYLPTVARFLAHSASIAALQKHVPPPWEWCDDLDDLKDAEGAEGAAGEACAASADAYVTDAETPSETTAAGASMELAAGDPDEDARLLAAWRSGGGEEVRVTALEVYRISGSVIVAAGDSTGMVVFFDVDGQVTRAEAGSAENQPGRKSALSLQDQRRWLLHQPILSRPVAAQWMTFWRGLAGALPSRCGCSDLVRRPLLPPRPAVRWPEAPHGTAVTALTRFSAYLAIARGSRLAFATAGHLRETGSICEVPGASSTGMARADTTIVSLAYDQLNSRFIWAGSAAGDVLVFDVRASATTRDSSRRAQAGVGQCRLSHRFSLASLAALDREQILEAAAGGVAGAPAGGGSDSEAVWESPLTHATVSTARGYAVAATLGGVFLFNSTGIGALAPRLEASRRASPQHLLGLVKDAANAPPTASQPALLALGHSMPRVGADPIAAWTLPLVCAGTTDAAPCESAVRAATLLLPAPFRPASLDAGWLRFPAIVIVLVGVVGYQLCSRGPEGLVEALGRFWARLRKLLGVTPDRNDPETGSGSARGGGFGGNPYSADTLSREQKMQVADLLRRAQAGRMGSRGIPGGGLEGLHGVFDDDSDAGRDGGGGGVFGAGLGRASERVPDARTESGDRWRREQLDALGLEAEMARLRSDDYGGGMVGRDSGMGLGYGDAIAHDDEPIGEWLEE